MYQNIFVDYPDKYGKQKVYLWDDIAGLVVSDYKPYAYKKNVNGKYKALTGESLDKVTSGFSYGEDGYFESDVPAITRVLIDCYGESDEVSKNHRILFFDIETETEGGYPKIDIAQQPITAIALYDFNVKKYICLVLDKSKTVSGYVEDDKVVHVFYKEEDLLEKFLDIYVKLNPTILSGWNCLHENSSVWKSDRIVKLKNISCEELLLDSTVKKKSDRNFKKSYILKLSDGREIIASKDHKFPVYSKNAEQYKNFNSKFDVPEDKTVEDMLNNKDEVFFVLKRRKNENRIATFFDIISSNIEKFICQWGLMIINETGVTLTNGADIIRHLNSNHEVIVKFSKFLNKKFIIYPKKEISEELLYSLGLLYTDGTLDKKNKCISIYNNEIKVLDRVAETLDKYKKRFNSKEKCYTKTEKNKPFGGKYKANFRYRTSLSNEFLILVGMVYENFEKKNRH